MLVFPVSARILSMCSLLNVFAITPRLIKSVILISADNVAAVRAMTVLSSGAECTRGDTIFKARRNLLKIAPAIYLRQAKIYASVDKLLLTEQYWG